MNMQTPSHLTLTRLSLAAAIACATLLAACGGGGGSDSDSDSASASASQPPSSQMLQSEATADSANASQTGTDTATSMDTVYSTTEAVVQSASGATAPVTNTVVNCAGGGTATLTIHGGTPATQLNGKLDTGERYTITYAQCARGSGYPQLTGSVEMNITSASGSSTSGTNAASIRATQLSLTSSAGSTVLDGSGTVSHSSSTATDGSTTTIAHVTVPNATLTNSYSGRNGSFTLSDLDATRTVKWVAGTITSSQYSGHHSLSGSANGRAVSLKVSTNGSISYDASGTLFSGQWTVTNPNATIVTTVSNGSAVLTVDDSSDGTIDHTWTFPRATLITSAS